MDQTQKSSKNPTYYYTSPTYPDSSSLKHVSPSTSSTSASTSSSPVTYSSSQKQECRPISLSSSYNDLRAPHTDHLQQQKQFYSYTSPSTSLAFVSLTEPRSFHSTSNNRRRSDRSSKKKKEQNKAMVLTNIKVLARPSSAQKETMVDPTPSPLPSSKLYTNYVAKQDPSMTNSFEELTLNEEIEYIPGTLSIQLLDKTGKLRTSDLKKLLKDHPNSLVIGVFGRSGLGKSYILSKFSDVEPEVPFTIATPDSSASSPKPFAVYAHITPHRFILLDTQLYIPSKQSLSPTTLLRRSKEVSLDPSTTSVYLETLNVQLCAWLLSVTDVCFFFHSQPTVPSDFLECFNKAKGIAQRMPFSMNSSVPVFIRNRVPISEYVPDFYQSFLLSTESTLLDDAKPLGLQLHTLFPSLLSTLTSSEEDPWVNHFWFPDFTLDPQLYPLSFEECLDYVQCKTYAMEKKRVQSEMDWVKLIIQAWDFLKRSEYMIKA